MKKTYVKPEVNQIEVAANQAVAACSLMTAYWQNWDNRLPNGYPSYEAAMNAQPDPQSSTAYKVCPVYYYEYSYKTDEYNTSTGSGYWEDWNNNGVWDGYGTDNMQSQAGDIPKNLSTSWQGNVIGS